MKRYRLWQRLFCVFGRLVLLIMLTAVIGCDPNSKIESPSSARKEMPLRDINAVLSDHDDALMAIEGVVGVAVGLRQDGKTLCLKVLVVEKTPELVRRVPPIIEGYPVEIEESGVIRPY